MELVQADYVFAFMLLSLVMGFVMGYLLAVNRAHKTVDAQVSEKVAGLKSNVESETRTRVERVVREELTDTVRAELVERFDKEIREEAEREARHIKEDAETAASARLKEADLEAKELVLAARKEAEAENQKRRNELEKLEERLSNRESAIDARSEKLDRRESELESSDRKIGERLKELEMRESKLRDKEGAIVAELEKVANYSVDEAKRELVGRISGEAKIEAAKLVRQIEEEATEEADKRAKKILSVAMQRWAGEYVTERTVSVVQLPSDDLKGRIIGREGRNIRALEAATGMDIIIDDTPEAVVVSGFDPVRRHIATLSLEKLLSDGRIHPSRIEEIVEKTKEEVEREIKDYGEQAGFELGLHGLHGDLIKLLGRLRYRTSYGQNMWSHSIEVGFLCGLMASELGIDVKTARRAGLLHDIGKALTHEQEGSHALIGAEIARKCGETEIVRNAIAAHHNEEPQNSVIAHLVIAADALSGARPGARREILETYVQRLKDLERISSDFEGVERSFAVQAGREIRVMVENSTVNDDQAFALSKEIARKIEEELTYPGQIKVCVIRETRAVDYAR